MLSGMANRSFVNMSKSKKSRTIKEMTAAKQDGRQTNGTEGISSYGLYLTTRTTEKGTGTTGRDSNPADGKDEGAGQEQKAQFVARPMTSLVASVFT